MSTISFPDWINSLSPQSTDGKEVYQQDGSTPSRGDLDDKASLSSLGSMSGQDSDDVDITGGDAVFNNLRRGNLRIYDFESAFIGSSSGATFGINTGGNFGSANGRYIRGFITTSSADRTSLAEFLFIRRGSESNGLLKVLFSEREDQFAPPINITHNSSDDRIEIEMEGISSGGNYRLKMFFMTNYNTSVQVV